MKIAVTGGIGAGKSEVMKIIGEAGYETISADEINARLLQSDDYVKKLQILFPDAVKDGRVDKAALRGIVFNDGRELAKLNAVAHPAICAEIEKSSAENIFAEVPLLFESGMQDMFDKIIAVTAPVETRLKRVFERGGPDEATARKIIGFQISDGGRLENADYIIENDASVERLRGQVDKILKNIFSPSN